MRISNVCCVLVPAILAACTSALENPVTVFADPGQYEFHNCEQLAVQRAAAKAREEELKRLMNRAEQSTGGTLVNVIGTDAPSERIISARPSQRGDRLSWTSARPSQTDAPSERIISAASSRSGQELAGGLAAGLAGDSRTRGRASQHERGPSRTRGRLSDSRAISAQ
jgi:hypothetical protein